MLCQNAFSFKFVFQLGNKGTFGKISLTIKTTEQHSVFGSKMMPSFKWPIEPNFCSKFIVVSVYQSG